MTIIFSLHEDFGLLPYFLRYYADRGITRFLCGLPDGSPHYPDIAAKLRDYPHQIFHTYEGPPSGRQDALARSRARRELVAPDDWFVIADTDEFHHCPEHPNFVEMRDAAKKEGAGCVASVLVDRIAADGSIPALDYSQSLDDQFPLATKITKNVSNGWADKIIMLNSLGGSVSGHHTSGEVHASFTGQTHHFKWQGREFTDRMRERVTLYKMQGHPWWREPLCVLEHLEANGGKFNLADPKLEVQPATKLGI